jgi:hypothetical protein
VSRHDDEVYDFLYSIAAGVALREAASYLVTALKILRALGYDPGDLELWPVILADAAWEFDPTCTRAPQEYRHAQNETPE